MARREIVALSDSVQRNPAVAPASSTAIAQLKTAAIRHFGVVAPSLPRLVSVISRVTLPAIVHAHDFYGDAWYRDGRESELVVRNGIRHPAFVLAGKSLEIAA